MNGPASICAWDWSQREIQTQLPSYTQPVMTDFVKNLRNIFVLTIILLFLIYIEGTSNLKIPLISSFIMFIVKIRLAGQLAKYRKQVLFTCFRVGSRDCEPWAYVTSIPKVIDDWFGCFLGALKKTKNSIIFLIFQLYWPSKKSEKIIFSILTS